MEKYIALQIITQYSNSKNHSDNLSTKDIKDVMRVFDGVAVVIHLAAINPLASDKN
jgi:hypothetical protein